MYVEIVIDFGVACGKMKSMRPEIEGGNTEKVFRLD